MKFADPIWFIPGVAACALLVWSFLAFDRRQLAAMATFASGHLLAQLTASLSALRRMFKRALLLLAVAGMFTALARPQWGFRWEEAKRRGVDVLFAVDTSKSMLTQDMKPDRLTRAKLAVSDMVDKLDGDRVGLIAFAGTAFLQSPLTLDYDAFGQALDALDTQTIPRGGTDIASAIHEAQKAFRLEGNNQKILILMTDGEDLAADGIDAARAAAKDGLNIYTVGIGSAAGGLIPVPSENGGTEFVKDANGQLVHSHLDEKSLAQIAAATGGIYQPLGAQGLQAIYEKGIAHLAKHDLASRMQRVYTERYKWPLALALLCLVLEMAVGDRKHRFFSRPVRQPVIAARPRRKPVFSGAVAAGALLLVCGPRLHASTRSAEEAYQHQDFAAARREYEAAAKAHPKQQALVFNTGSAAYKAGDFGNAANAFQTTLHTDELPLQQQAYYNLGNTQYRLGQQTEKAKPEETIKTWKSAVTSYDSALQLNAKDADAKFNRDFVQKKLDQLQKQQQQQKQRQKQDQKDQKDQKNQQPQDQRKQNGGKQDQQSQKPDQAKNQGGSKDQQSQPKDSKGDQQDSKPGDQAKNQPDSAGKQPGKSGEQKPGQQSPNAGSEQQQQPQPQQMAKADPSQTQPEGEPKPDKADAGQEQSAPAISGQMTKEEARALLDSLKPGERKMSAQQVPVASGSPEDNKPLQDW